jgi:prepilin-type N-terminal cleavage/methylation domain-containing protein
MRTRGFTFIEILLVVTLIGIMAAIGIPRIRNAIQKNNVRGARAALGTLVAKTRAAAVQRGCKAAIHFTSGSMGTVWVTACKVSNSALTDTLGGVEQFADRYSVTLSSTGDSVTFMPNGVSPDNTLTILRFSASGINDSVMINQVGKVVR